MSWLSREHTPSAPMRRIKYAMGSGISGYPTENDCYFTNLKAARAAAAEEVEQYLEALGAYDANGKRWRPGHDNHISLSKEGPYKWRLDGGQGLSRYVVVWDVEESLYFDEDGDVYERKEDAEGKVTWEFVPQDY